MTMIKSSTPRRRLRRRLLARIPGLLAAMSLFAAIALLFLQMNGAMAPPMWGGGAAGADFLSMSFLTKNATTGTTTWKGRSAAEAGVGLGAVDVHIEPSILPPPPEKLINRTTRTVLEPPHGTMRLRVLVMTYDRSASLHRLLTSLVEADYLGEVADLDIWIDRPPVVNTVVRSHKSSVVEVAESIVWPHGSKTVHLREENVGLARQWHEMWNLSIVSSGDAEGLTLHTREKAVILEDDLELSPHFWRWLRWCHHSYGDLPDFAGCTLQRANLCAAFCSSLGGSAAEGVDHTPNFMYPLVGSWGYSPSASHWVNFTSWYREFVTSGEKPYVDGVVVSKWYKTREDLGVCPGPRCIWTMHHLKYADTHRDQYTVYVEAGGEAGRTTLGSNWQEKGMNQGKSLNKTKFKRNTVWDDGTLGHFDVDPTRLNWSAKPVGGGKGLETSWEKKKRGMMSGGAGLMISEKNVKVNQVRGGRLGPRR